MAARKKQKTRGNGDSPGRPAGPASMLPVQAAVPSALQKCLLAAAVLVEAAWVAALVTMALAE